MFRLFSSLVRRVYNHNQIMAPKQIPAKATIVRSTENESRTTGTDADRVEAPFDVAELEAADDDDDAAEDEAD